MPGESPGRDPLVGCSHLVVALGQHLVVLAERHQEDDGGDVLKAVDPFPPLGPLTPHVHHPAGTTTILTQKVCDINLQWLLFPGSTHETGPAALVRDSSPEDNVIHVKGVLDDARGRHSDSEDVLQVGYIRGLRNAIQVGEIAEKRESVQ